MDADWHAFCQAIYEGIEGKESEELYHYRDTGKAAGATKASESHRAKAMWAMKAAKDRGDDFYDPARKDNILGRHQTRQRAPQRPHGSIGRSFEVFGESVSKLIVGSRLFVKLALHGWWPSGLRHGAKDVGQTAVGKVSGPIWIRGTACVCEQSPRIGRFLGSMGRMESSSSSF